MILVLDDLYGVRALKPEPAVAYEDEPRPGADTGAIDLDLFSELASMATSSVAAD